MEISNGRLVVVDRLAAGVRAARFTRPDNRAQLDAADIEDSPLFQDLLGAALEGLSPGDALVLNFGLVTRFPTAFYRLLLRVREAVQSRHARLFLCGMSAEILEGVHLFKGEKLFDLVANEDQALHQAQTGG
jgi:anti-anti-sigma regulatory factor